MTNHPHRSKRRTLGVNDTGFPPTPGISSAAEKVISSLERGERLAAAYGRGERIRAHAPDMLAILKAVAGCPQAAPWLARLPLGDGNTWDALQAILAAVEGQ